MLVNITQAAPFHRHKLIKISFPKSWNLFQGGEVRASYSFSYNMEAKISHKFHKLFASIKMLLRLDV
jgi:hypothetical protein